MNIAYVIAYPGLGGSEKYSVYLASEAQKSGNQVSFIVGEDGPLTKELERLHIPFEVVPMGSSFNPFKLFGSVTKLKSVLRETGAEIVHTNMLREHSIAIIAKLTGSKIPVVRTFHRLDNFNWKMKPLISIYNYLTDAFIAVSSYMAEKMIERGLSEKKITVIYNGNPDYQVTRHEKNIGFLGRISAEKGILNLAEKAGSTKLVIAGDGPESEKLRKLYSKKHEILGDISDLASYFESISILVLPTKAESTIPLSVTEGFSAGVPTIIFDIPTLSNENFPGLITVEQGDFEGLLSKAEELINNPEELERLSKSARETYEKQFKISRMWKETNCLYEKL